MISIQFFRRIFSRDEGACKHSIPNCLFLVSASDSNISGMRSFLAQNQKKIRTDTARLSSRKDWNCQRLNARPAMAEHSQLQIVCVCVYIQAGNHESIKERLCSVCVVICTAWMKIDSMRRSGRREKIANWFYTLCPFACLSRLGSIRFVSISEWAKSVRSNSCGVHLIRFSSFFILCYATMRPTKQRLLHLHLPARKRI